MTRATRLDELPELLRVGEAAAWLGVAPGTVYSAVAAGTIRGVRLGRLLRVPRAELARLAGRENADGA